MKARFSHGPACLLLLLSLCVAWPKETLALTRSFGNGANDEDWFNEVNWQPEGEPADTDQLIVSGGLSAATAQNVITSNGGSITISNTGTDLTFGGLSIGLFGQGGMLIQDGAHVHGFFTEAGTAAGSEGTIQVIDNGTVWDANQLITVGGSGSGILNIEGGAQVTSIAGVLADDPNGEAAVTVTGTDSSWTLSSRLDVGNRGAASLTIDGGTVTNGQATLGILGQASSGEVMVTGGGLWEVNGTLTVGGEGSGLLEIGPGGSVNSNFANVSARGQVVVDGAGATWTNIVANDLNIGTGPTANGQVGLVTLSNGGMLDASGGVKVLEPGKVMLDGGTLQASGPVTVFGGLSGVGTVEGNVVNHGVVRPGANLGTLTVDGNYQAAFNSALEVELDYPNDVLDVNGDATLGGILQIQLNGFVASGGNDYVVLTADSLGGVFQNVANGQRLYTLDPEGGSFIVNYGIGSPFGANSVVLTNYEQGLPGDYNNDGTVDGDDFLAWQRGESVAPFSGVDLFIWGISYGTTDGFLKAGSTTVPEPTSALMIMAAIIAGIRLRWVR